MRSKREAWWRRAFDYAIFNRVTQIVTNVTENSETVTLVQFWDIEPTAFTPALTKAESLHVTGLARRVIEAHPNASKAVVLNHIIEECKNAGIIDTMPSRRRYAQKRLF